MESAIAKHLQCPRTRTRRIEDDYAPPYPCWTSRADQDVTQVAMAYFGVQSKGGSQHGQACRALMHITAGFAQTDGPGHHDLTHYVDADGYDNMVAIAYWSDPAVYRRWRDSAAVAAWWNDPQRLHDGIGYFREVLTPRIEHFETMFNTPDHIEGVGVVMQGLSEPFQEHGYWGSMRDRIPLAQTEALTPQGRLHSLDGAPGAGRRVRIAGHDNVAIIRSGQEWTQTEGQERRLYLDEMEPVLAAGMNFLRDQGSQVGCYSNRYMTHIDAAGRPLEKSFGVSYWRSLADMERWSESHPTHVEIFATFMRMVQALQFQLKLSVYHEVSILKPDEQDYEYINCHAHTGLMNGVAAAAG
jgi:aldoxime dehydratase